MPAASGAAQAAAALAALGQGPLGQLRNSNDAANGVAAAASARPDLLAPFGPGAAGEAAAAAAAAAYGKSSWGGWPPSLWWPPPWGAGSFPPPPTLGGLPPMLGSPPPLGSLPPGPFDLAWLPSFGASPDLASTKDSSANNQTGSPEWTTQGQGFDSADAAAGPAVRVMQPMTALAPVIAPAAAQEATDSKAAGNSGVVVVQSRFLRLRGLPFSSTEQDVLSFFAKHDIVDTIADEAKVVKLLPKANGKPSGQAVVTMRSAEDCEQACKLLNGQWIGTRYIEVCLHVEDEHYLL